MSEKFTDWRICVYCNREFEVNEELASYICICRKPQSSGPKPLDLAIIKMKRANRMKKINAFFDKILGRTELKQRINDLKKGNHDLANQNMAQKGQLWVKDKKLTEVQDKHDLLLKDLKANYCSKKVAEDLTKEIVRLTEWLEAISGDAEEHSGEPTKASKLAMKALTGKDLPK